MVIRKIIRAVDKDKQLTRTSILKAMMMLNKAWGEMTEQTIQNCFRKLGISLKTREGAMEDDDNPFKGILDDAEDDGAVYDIEFDLNKLRKAKPDLAPKNLDADCLVDFDWEVATNESRPLSVDEIINECFPQAAETVEDGSSDKDEIPVEIISSSLQNEVDVVIEILNRLTLFTTDLDPRSLTSESLKQNKSKKIGQNETIFYWWFFLTNSNYSILILLFL